MSQSKNYAAVSEGQWPPRSPYDVLLSTPGGRDRLRRLADRASPSPSPIKRSNTTPSLRHRPQEISMSTMALGDLEDDDEDEETLQLQLQEIQARLKLKKLQKAKAKDGPKAPNVEKEPVSGDAAALLATTSSAAASRSHQGNIGIQRQRLESSKPQESVHIPASPTRRVQSTEPSRSPGRVLLGIDKGLKGRDVSLRRAPSLRNASNERVMEPKHAGGYLHRANSQTSTHRYVTSRPQSSLDEKPRTFSQRMTDARNEEAGRREKDARIKRARSKAFDIDAQEMEIFKTTATSLPEAKPREQEFSRDEIINAYNKSVGLLQRSKSTPTISSGMTTKAPKAASTITTNSPSAQRSTRAEIKAASSSSEALSSASSEFESFSSLHLSKRIIPHNVLTRTLAGKKTFTIPDLFKVVVAPHFRLPDVEEDIVLLAIIAAKSEPREHKSKTSNHERGKYMVMTLTDLKWELDLFLFSSGFDKFWKLTIGTVIAILNPAVMPPMTADTGRFSLKLISSEDTVLEIGAARDLGFCKSVKKDGKTCDSWIDKRHTEYCDFHVNETLKKTIAGRMEVNTMNFGKKRGGSPSIYGVRKSNSRVIPEYVDPKMERSRYDRETHSKIYIGAPMRGGVTSVRGSERSTIDLLDDEGFDPDTFHRGVSKEERMRRQLAATEKEKSIAQKLGRIGGGLGADYLRVRDQPSPASSSTVGETSKPPDGAALGLLGGQAKEIHLTPIKRKRAGTDMSGGSTALGWGAHLTKELGRMKEGERLQPVRKKTRFVTAKGIREAGRESFGGDVPPPGADDNDDDDDDDLDIVR